MTTPEAIQEIALRLYPMMEAWNVIYAAAREQSPTASDEIVYQMAKSAMNHTLFSEEAQRGVKTMHTPTTTAQARAWAYDAHKRCDYAAAANLYDVALRLYPQHTGALAQADRDLLAHLRSVCESCADTVADAGMVSA